LLAFIEIRWVERALCSSVLITLVAQRLEIEPVAIVVVPLPKLQEFHIAFRAP
jgi:hypothetical protein